MGEEKAKKPRAKRKPVAELPRLMTHREVEEHFCVTPAGPRRWVAKGEFPVPHSIISQMWYYRKDMIAHRIRTGEWTQGVGFLK